MSEPGSQPEQVPLPPGPAPVSWTMLAPVWRNSEAQLLAEKIECFKADFAQRGINEYVAAPPTWRLAWKLGFDVPPPRFMDFSQLVLFAGGLFGLLWGIAKFCLAGVRRVPPLSDSRR